MSPMCAGDVIVLAQGFAQPYGDRFLADVQVGDARHPRAGVEFVGGLLERPNPDHLLVGIKPVFGVHFGPILPGSVCLGHSVTPCEY